MPGWGDVINQMGLRRPAQARFDGMRRTGRGSMGGGARNNPGGGAHNNGNNRGNGGGGAGGGRAPGFSVRTSTTPAPTGQEALTNTGYGVTPDQWATMAPSVGTAVASDPNAGGALGGLGGVGSLGYTLPAMTMQQYNQADDFARLNNAQQQQLGGNNSGYVLDVNAGGGVPLSVSGGTFLRDPSTGLSTWQEVAGALDNWKPVTVTQEYGTRGGGRRNRNRR